MEKRLYRSQTERMAWGVCGGLAKYLDLDPTIVRLIFVLLLFANGIGILIYIILAIVVPLEGSKTTESKETIKENVAEMKEAAEGIGKELRASLSGEESPDASARAKRNRNFIGIALIIVGIIFLMGSLNFFRWMVWIYIWPSLIIVVGLILIISNKKSK
ncbi:PspC domain-containing protein [Chloroflexota bacterium]